MRFAIFASFLFILCFSACTSFAIKPVGVSGYTNGIAIIQQEDEKSKIQFEIAQESIEGFEGTPLLIYVALENLSDEKWQFKPENLSFFMNGKKILPYSYQGVMRFNVNLNQVLYSYGIETTDAITPIPDLNPFFGANSYHVYPIPTPLYGGFVMRYKFSDYSFARASAYVNYMKGFNARKFLIMHYLRTSTLGKNDVKGGFIAIPYGKLKEGNLSIQFNISDVVHNITVEIKKRK